MKIQIGDLKRAFILPKISQIFMKDTIILQTLMISILWNHKSLV